MPAFGLLLAVAALSAMIAVVQNALALAVLGTSGGFLAPILASTGGGSHVMRFSYYAVLNAGILAIAWFKAWRVLNLVGFAFTFAIGTLWGVNFYRPEHLASTEPFLALFFAFYLAIPILFARRRASDLERYVDGSLVFGVPLVTFGLQVGLVREIEYGAAWSALALGAVYLVLANVVFGSRGETLRLLAEAFLALGVVFGSLAIPLGLDGRWTSAAWALEGAAIVWVGARQQRLSARVFGIALQFLGGAAFLADQTRVTGFLFLANSAYVGCVFLAVAGLFCAWYLDRHRPALTEPERIAADVLFGWGIAWWVGGALAEIDRHVPQAYRFQAMLVFLTASCAAFSWLHTRIAWRLAGYPAQAVTPLMIVALGASVLQGIAQGSVQERHPLAHLGYIGWPLALAAHFFLLRRHEAAGSRYQYWAHAAGVWLLAVLGIWEIAWGIDRLVAGRAVWPIIGWAIVPGVLLTVLALRGARIAWPVAAHRDAYLLAGSVPLAVFLVLCGFLVNFVSNGDPAPLPLRADSQPARPRRDRRRARRRALALRVTAARTAADRDGAAHSGLRSARRAPVRVGERRAPADASPLGRSAVHPGRDATLGRRADGLLDPLDSGRAGQHGRRHSTQPAGRLDRRRGADGRRGGQALHDRSIQRRHDPADRVVRRRRRSDARPRLLLAGAAEGSARGAMKALIAALLLVPALAAAEQPRDFAYGIPLRTSGQDALQQLELPRAVYEGVVHPDLSDLRVFNGAGEVVAHAFRPRVITTKEKPGPVAATLFPIRSDESTGVEGVELHLERRGDRTVVDLRTRQGRPARDAKLVGYLADARALDKPIRAVVLELPAAADQIFARVTIEASDDLRQWSPLASGAPVVRLASGGERLEQLRIEVSPRRAKYLRVSWPGRSGSLELAGLAVEPGELAVAAPRQWKQLAGVAAKDKPGEYEFDLGGQFPVDRLRIGLPQQNTVASVQLLVRSKPADPWRHVTTATAYRLIRDGDELTSADSEIGALPDRYWLARVDQRGGGIGGGPLALSAGWVPHRLVFASRGQGPFQLAYGSRDAKSTAFPIATLVPGYRDEEEAQPRIVIGAAQTAAEPRRLGGEAVTRERVDWKRWTLWGSLVLGVVVLGWMALRLGRQMSRPA